MVPSSFGPMASLNDLWAVNRTLIVVYADDYTRVSHPFLWTSVPQVQSDDFLFERISTNWLIGFLGMG